MPAGATAASKVRHCTTLDESTFVSGHVRYHAYLVVAISRGLVSCKSAHAVMQTVSDAESPNDPPGWRCAPHASLTRYTCRTATSTVVGHLYFVALTAPTPAVETVGSSSHTTDSEFCSAHACIGSFTTENGTIVECSDGTYSHAGGIAGACSDHGGELK
jgi:hypothetical protein